MPALWSPEDLATRFATYIEELHDLFAMHGLHYGSPEDIRRLAAQLDTNDLLKEELGSLVRSMVLREGGSIPRTDLLEIVAIAVAGPRMDAVGEDLQQAVRQLLTFLHGALRRPWNEPHGEERLHPGLEDPRAEAARELREAAARIEAEAQSSAQQAEPAISAEDTGDDYSPRRNVIPFGRARAVFSRLAYIDGTEFDGPIEQNETAPPLPAESAQIAEPQSEAPDADAAVVATDLPLAAQQENDNAFSRMPMAAAHELASEPKLRHKAPWLEAPVSFLTEDVLETKDAIAEDANEPEKTNEVPEPFTTEAQEHAPEPFFAAVPIPVSEVPVATIVSEFDEEPPLPATTRVNRVAFMSGIAATILIAVGLVFAIKARPGTTETASSSLPSQQQPVEVSHATKPAAIVAASSISSRPAPATDSSKPKTQVSNDESDSASGDDGDYVAPPYSNLPPSVAPATTAADEPVTQRQPVQPPTSPAPGLERRDPSLQQVSEVRTAPLRPSDPDASIAGDHLVEAGSLALAEPPLHPSIPPTVMAENLVSGPIPDYPMLAKLAHADGTVVLHAEITPRGTVSDTHVISGHFLLRRAAEAAVKHWKYRPYQVDGKAVPVSTTITVHFKDDH